MRMNQERESASNGVGVVVIGRNEASRLRTCLSSVFAQVDRDNVVYVDSGSADDSVEIARRVGVAVVELDPDQPFSAARARNEGFKFLRRRNRSTEYVQFVDGDCELIDGWIEQARESLHVSDATAVVCGTLRERHPDRSIYNRLCALEWARPPGRIRWCGGIFMVRGDAFDEVGGFRTTMVAGEEPELCARLRNAGWTILRIEADMAIHDADMTRFRQWWTRSARAGFGWADRISARAVGRDPSAVRQVGSIIAWALLLPITVAATVWLTQGLTLLLLLAYPVQAVRIAATAMRRRGLATDDAGLFAVFTVLWKFAALTGLIRYAVIRLTNRPARLFEHKQPQVEARGTT